jgi:hypothetical protein
MEGISLFIKKNVLVFPQKETIKSGNLKYSAIFSGNRRGNYSTDFYHSASLIFIKTKQKYTLGEEQESSDLVITDEGRIFFI